MTVLYISFQLVTLNIIHKFKVRDKQVKDVVHRHVWTLVLKNPCVWAYGREYSS